MLLTLVTILSLDHATFERQLTLPDRARANNGTTVQMMGVEFDAAPLPRLAAEADVIVHGTIARVDTMLSPDEMVVLTVYTITPHRLLKERTPVLTAGRPQPTKVLRVASPGGTVSDSRGVMTTVVDVYPEKDRFAAGDEGLFFLVENGDTFAFAHGPSGAFHVKNGTLRAMTKEIAERRGDQPRQLSEVLRDVESIVRKR
jgi:hypothetical protein